MQNGDAVRTAGLQMLALAHAELFLIHGSPAHLRPDNGPEFVATALRDWLAKLRVRAEYIEPGSPWENGYIESFNVRVRDEMLNGGIFYFLGEARLLIGSWRYHYNKTRPHSALG